MKQKHAKAPCKRCKKSISSRTDGSGPIAHKCPHGKACAYPQWNRGAQRAELPGCLACMQDRDRERKEGGGGDVAAPASTDPRLINDKGRSYP